MSAGMSRHDFTLRIQVDEDALRDYNRDSENGVGLPFPDDPSEWFGDDLLRALEAEVARIDDIVGYSVPPYGPVP